MKNDICFVCVGQCGGNNGVVFERNGYDVFYLNTASDDIKALTGATHTWVTPGTHGCNQDAMKAKSILSQYADKIIAQIDRFATKRVVYLISSAGGGTSAMTPLLTELLLEHYAAIENEEWDTYDAQTAEGLQPSTPVHRKVGMISVLPSIAESPQINANAYTFMQEVIDLTSRALAGDVPGMASVFLVDNENSDNRLSLNEEFVAMFNEVVQIPDKHHSINGNVDAADLDKAFTSPGVCAISKIDGDLSIRDLVNGIRHSNIFATTEDASGMFWVSSTKERLNTLEIEKELGAPRTHFFTYNPNTNYFLVSGMGFPVERLDVMAQRAKEFKMTAIKIQRDVEKSSLEDDLSFMSEPLVVRTTRGNRTIPAQSGQVAVVSTEGMQVTTNTPVTRAKPDSASDKLSMFRQRRQI